MELYSHRMAWVEKDLKDHPESHRITESFCKRKHKSYRDLELLCISRSEGTEKFSSTKNLLFQIAFSRLLFQQWQQAQAARRTWQTSMIGWHGSARMSLGTAQLARDAGVAAARQELLQPEDLHHQKKKDRVKVRKTRRREEQKGRWGGNLVRWQFWGRNCTLIMLHSEIQCCNLEEGIIGVGIWGAVVIPEEFYRAAAMHQEKGFTEQQLWREKQHENQGHL